MDAHRQCFVCTPVRRQLGHRPATKVVPRHAGRQQLPLRLHGPSRPMHPTCWTQGSSPLSDFASSCCSAPLTAPWPIKWSTQSTIREFTGLMCWAAAATALPTPAGRWARAASRRQRLAGSGSGQRSSSMGGQIARLRIFRGACSCPGEEAWVPGCGY